MIVVLREGVLGPEVTTVVGQVVVAWLWSGIQVKKLACTGLGRVSRPCSSPMAYSVRPDFRTCVLARAWRLGWPKVL